MSNFVVQNGYNLEALGAPNHLGVASDPYSNGHYPAGQTGRIHEITYPGQVMYWVVFCCMAASATAFAAMTFSTPMALRSHGYLSTTIVTIAAIAYYVMASHGGSAHTLNPDGNLRDIYYARYIDWFFTTPLLLLDIILMANTRLGTTLWIVLADVATIVTGLFGALSINEYRWGYYVISCFFFLVVLAGLFGPGVQGAHVRGGKIAALYTGLAAYLSFFWFGYPIVWGFCEGADYATVTAEAIAYGFLDFFTKVVFGWVLMLSLKPVHDASNGSFLTNFTGNPFIPADDIVSDKRGLAGFGGARNNAPGNTAGGAHIPGNEAAAPHTEAGAAAV